MSHHPLPYGVTPDGQGWLKPDPETYSVLLWILERRAESQGYHTIAKALNQGIDMGSGIIVPPTPSLLAYRRKPYREYQDPETGDIIELPRPLPAATWHKKTIEGICQQAVDGIYAGILQWGRSYNRFQEDADGNLKTPVRVDTGHTLVSADLLARVQAVECMPADGATKQSTYNTFLLSLRCGICGEAMHGYTSTKIKPSGLTYRYRKYRCAGRANNPGACEMPILSAESLEQVVIKAVFTNTAQLDGERLQDQLNDSIERHRKTLLEALKLIGEKLQTATQQRDEALAAVMDRTLSATLKAAMAERAEQLVGEYQEAVAQQQMLRASLDSLTAKARSVLAVLTDPSLDPTRWKEPAVFAAFRRALTLLVKNAVVSEGNTRSTFFVQLSVTTDPIATPNSASVVRMGSTRARASVDSRLIITETITIKK